MRPLLAAALVLLAFAAANTVAAQEAGEGVVGATVFVDPLSSELRVPRERVQVGRETTIRATVLNNGPVRSMEGTATLLIDTRGVLIQGGPDLAVPPIRPHSERQVSWQVCGLAPGSYLAMAVITSADAAGHPFRTETSAVLLEVETRQARGKPC